MSVASHNGTRVAFLSGNFVKQAVRCPEYRQQRRWRSFGSALHEGLRRDTDRRESRFTRDRRSSPRFTGPSRNSYGADREPRSPRHRPQEPWGKQEPWGDQEPEQEQGFIPSIRTASPNVSLPMDPPPRQRRIFPETRRISPETRHTSPETQSATRYPLSIPHTTASSEFLYGYNTVYAALRANKRTAYKLYIHSRGSTRDEDAKQQHATVRSMARKAGIQLVEGDRLDVRLLDKMSGGRPHNGIILEASPLPIRTITSPTQLNLHSKNPSQQPLILLLDSVLDAGNLGAILRTAGFLGISNVILTNHCAPLNAVSLKSSAGAAEALTIYRTDNPSGFLENATAAGWNALCATTPGTRRGGSGFAPVDVPERGVRYHFPSSTPIPATKAGDVMDSVLRAKPQIIVAGGEGQGLRKFITDKASAFVEILPGDNGDVSRLVGLDSLNVSVAVAMVCMEVKGRMGVALEEQQEQEAEREREVRTADLSGGDLGFSFSAESETQIDVHSVNALSKEEEMEERREAQAV